MVSRWRPCHSSDDATRSRPRRSRVAGLLTLVAAPLLLLAAALVPTPTNAQFSATTTNTGNSFNTATWGFGDDYAVWANTAGTTPVRAAWNGVGFGGPTTTSTLGRLRIMQGATSPTRDEALICGISSTGNVVGELWQGASFSPLTGLGTVSQTFWWGCDVAYGAAGGDAMLVYADGSNLNYRVWDGTVWTPEASITSPIGGTPRQLQLAAHPTTDEMVLVYSNNSSQDAAVVWNGSSWGSGIVLSPNGSGNDRTDVYVAYEQQSGRAMVVYGKGTDDVHYQLWDSATTGWQGELVFPGLGGGYARWTTLGADPQSDRIAMGVLTNDFYVWLAMWNGSSWVDQTKATDLASGVTHPAMAVAFEGSSGQALAVFGESTGTIRYRTWPSATGWSPGPFPPAPNIGATSNSMMLYPSTGADGLMLVVQDALEHVHWIPWDGAVFGADFELETSSGETKNQPFLFLGPDGG